METLLAPLREMEEYTQLRLAVDKGETPVTVVGGMEAQKCHMIYGMEDLADVRLIVTYNEIRARELLEDYRLYDKKCDVLSGEGFDFLQCRRPRKCHCGRAVKGNSGACRRQTGDYYHDD